MPPPWQLACAVVAFSYILTRIVHTVACFKEFRATCHGEGRHHTAIIAIIIVVFVAAKPRGCSPSGISSAFIASPSVHAAKLPQEVQGTIIVPSESAKGTYLGLHLHCAIAPVDSVFGTSIRAITFYDDTLFNTIQPTSVQYHS